MNNKQSENENIGFYSSKKDKTNDYEYLLLKLKAIKQTISLIDNKFR